VEDQGLITAADVMPLLLRACPSFALVWAEVEGENVDEDSPANRLGYLDAGDFVRDLVALKLSDQTKEFPAVFEVIERLICEGDDYVQNLGVIGYVEGFQMMTVTAAGLDPDSDFRPYLRPKSEESWEALNQAWTQPPPPPE
jgi:hypothetical protein